MNLIPSIHDTKESPIATTHREKTIGRSPINSKDKQTSLSSGDKVYLYGDLTYTGKLIHPIERTYPPRWTVQLDRGGYEAVNLNHISLIESKERDWIEPEAIIPFSDEPDLATDKLTREIIALKRENARLKQENDLIKKDLDIAKQVIRRAKDISPLMRISLKRVLRLAQDACMDVQRTVGGWILKMGNKARRFRRLADIWDILSQDEWYLSDIFPEDKLVALDLILPPRPRKKPVSLEKKTYPMISREEVLRRRRMGMPKCC